MTCGERARDVYVLSVGSFGALDGVRNIQRDFCDRARDVYVAKSRSRNTANEHWRLSVGSFGAPGGFLDSSEYTMK